MAQYRVATPIIGQCHERVAGGLHHQRPRMDRTLHAERSKQNVAILILQITHLQYFIYNDLNPFTSIKIEI